MRTSRDLVRALADRMPGSVVTFGSCGTPFEGDGSDVDVWVQTEGTADVLSVVAEDPHEIRPGRYVLVCVRTADKDVDVLCSPQPPPSLGLMSRMVPCAGMVRTYHACKRALAELPPYRGGISSCTLAVAIYNLFADGDDFVDVFCSVDFSKQAVTPMGVVARPAAHFRCDPAIVVHSSMVGVNLAAGAWDILGVQARLLRDFTQRV